VQTTILKSAKKQTTVMSKTNKTGRPSLCPKMEHSSKFSDQLEEA
jgi:hypothetical protein